MTEPFSDPTTWALGISTSWCRKLPEDLEACRTSGIGCIEVVLKGNDEDPFHAAKQTVAWAQDLGLRIHSVHLPYGWDWDISHPDSEKRLAARDRHTALLDQIARWQPKAVVIHPSYEPIPDDDRIERLQHCRDGLADLSKRAHEYGMTLCVECLPRTCLGNTSDEILFLTEGMDWLRVCCDVNHLLHETPHEFIRRVGDRIGTVHMSDYDGVDERHWPPGEGIIDWHSVIRELARKGYPGPFLFEVRSRTAEPVTAQGLVSWWHETLKTV